MTDDLININNVTADEKEKLVDACERINKKYDTCLTPEKLAHIHNQTYARLERQRQKNELRAINRLLSLLTKKEFEKLSSNWNTNQALKSQGMNTKDFSPVVKFFNPTGVGTWYLSELSPDRVGFGICHLSEYELGSVSLDELNTLKLRLPIEKERYFSANKRSLTECYALLKEGHCL